MIDFLKLKEIIEKNNSFLITTHVNPDADAIGSEIAFHKMLELLGKKSVVINHSETPYNLKFLDSENAVEKYEESKHKTLFHSADVLVALDFNRSDRMVSMRNIFMESTGIKICVDHHQDPEQFADYLFIDSNYSATGHILLDFIKFTKVIEIDKNIAAPLYAAIMTDTGSFRFERTTAKLHRLVAELLETGIDQTEIYSKLYDESKLSKIMLLGKCLTSLDLIADNHIGYMTICQNDFKELGAIESDTENFVNFIISVEGVNLGILFIELRNGFKVSFRSKGKLPVNKLAELFGGGGHLNAAGARFFELNMQDSIPKILEQAEVFYMKYSKG